MAIDPPTPSKHKILHETESAQRTTKSRHNFPEDPKQPPKPTPMSRPNVDRILDSATSLRSSIEGLIYRVGRMRGRDTESNSRVQTDTSNAGDDVSSSGEAYESAAEDRSATPPTIIRSGKKRARSPESVDRSESSTGYGRKRARSTESPEPYASTTHYRGKRRRSSEESIDSSIRVPKRMRRSREGSEPSHPIIITDDYGNGDGEPLVEYEDITEEVNERLRKKRELKMKQEEERLRALQARKRPAEDDSDYDTPLEKEGDPHRYTSPMKKARVDRGKYARSSPSKRTSQEGGGEDDGVAGRPIKRAKSRSVTPTNRAGRKRSASYTDTDSVTSEEEEVRRKRTKHQVLSAISE